MEKLYTIREIATYLNVHEKSVRRWIDNGRLDSTKVGGRIRVSQTQLDDFLKKDGK